MGNRDLKIAYNNKEYAYYEGSSGYLQNLEDWHDEYFIPPTLREIIKELSDEKAQSMLLGIMYLYENGMEQGKREFKKEFLNIFKMLFDIDED